MRKILIYYYMFTFILSILAALVVANLFTTFPILAAYYCTDADKRNKTMTAAVIIAILAINAYCIYTIIVNA